MRTDFRLTSQPAPGPMTQLPDIRASADNSRTVAEMFATGRPASVMDFNADDVWSAGFDGHLSVFRKG